MPALSLPIPASELPVVQHDKLSIFFSLISVKIGSQPGDEIVLFVIIGFVRFIKFVGTVPFSSSPLWLRLTLRSSPRRGSDSRSSKLGGCILLRSDGGLRCCLSSLGLSVTTERSSNLFELVDIVLCDTHTLLCFNSGIGDLEGDLDKALRISDLTSLEELDNFGAGSGELSLAISGIMIFLGVTWGYRARSFSLCIIIYSAHVALRKILLLKLAPSERSSRERENSSLPSRVKVGREKEKDKPLFRLCAMIRL